MYINDIRIKWNAGDYSCSVSIPQKVGLDHVFDLDKTVRENKEMAEIFNQDVTQRKKDLEAKKAALQSQFTSDIVSSLMTSYNFSESQAKHVSSYTNSKKSCMSDYFNILEEIADMVYDVLAL